VYGARGRIKILPDLAPLVLLDQRLQSGILGGGTAYQSAARGQTSGQQRKKGAAMGVSIALQRNFGHRSLDGRCARGERGRILPGATKGGRGANKFNNDRLTRRAGDFVAAPPAPTKKAPAMRPGPVFRQYLHGTGM
jgi:hypothetical protein